MSQITSIRLAQVNLQNAEIAQVEIGRTIKYFNKASSPFICLVQESKVHNSKLSWQPNTCKIYGSQDNPRTVIYTDSNTMSWPLESFNTKGLTAIQTSK